MSTRAVLRIYEQELRVIVSEILRYPNLETGGGLYGLWSHGDSPTIGLVSRPGPKAEQRFTKFVQDPDTHMRLEKKLWERHGVQCIGLWHSHHTLGLHVLSNGDVDRTRRYARHTRRERFAEILGYYLADGHIGLRPYVYRRASEGHCVATEVQVLPGRSPLREGLDMRRFRSFGDALAPAPRHLDAEFTVQASSPSVALPSEDGGVASMDSRTVALVGAVEELIALEIPPALQQDLTLLTPEEGYVILQIDASRRLRMLLSWEDRLVVLRWEVLAGADGARVLAADDPGPEERIRVRPLLQRALRRLQPNTDRSDDDVGSPPAVPAGTCAAGSRWPTA